MEKQTAAIHPKVPGAVSRQQRPAKEYGEGKQVVGFTGVQHDEEPEQPDRGGTAGREGLTEQRHLLRGRGVTRL